MDRDVSEEEESEKYLWLAALIIGICLILMLLAIAGIAIWRHFKKQDTADQSWAGPSPLADGNLHDEFNINECILSRQRSLSSLSTAPIVLNEAQGPHKGYDNKSMLQEHSEEAKTAENSITNMPTLPYILSETTCFASGASEGQKSNEDLQHNSLNDETFLPPPPPPDDLHFPMPPQIEDLLVTEERDIQPQPLLAEVPQSDEHSHHMLPNKLSKMGSVNSTYDPDDELLPPPPVDL